MSAHQLFMTLFRETKFSYEEYQNRDGPTLPPVVVVPDGKHGYDVMEENGLVPAFSMSQGTVTSLGKIEPDEPVPWYTNFVLDLYKATEVSSVLVSLT
jgi:hypothetical protein